MRDRKTRWDDTDHPRQKTTVYIMMICWSVLWKLLHSSTFLVFNQQTQCSALDAELQTQCSAGCRASKNKMNHLWLNTCKYPTDLYTHAIQFTLVLRWKKTNYSLRNFFLSSSDIEWNTVQNIVIVLWSALNTPWYLAFCVNERPVEHWRLLHVVSLTGVKWKRVLFVRCVT